MPDLEERVAALEAIVAGLTAEPAFMSEVRTDIFRNTNTEAVRLTHLPTGVTIEAPTRAEATTKLGRALERHAQRHSEGTPGAA